MKFRFNVSGPATFQSGGSAVVSLSKPPTFVSDDEPVTDSKVRPFYPNREPDTILKCGCSIPWPIIVLLGSGGKVQCDLHGWQPPVTEKEKQRARKASKKWQNNQSTSQDTQQSTLDNPSSSTSLECPF